jgi:hypothetical protein
MTKDDKMRIGDHLASSPEQWAFTMEPEVSAASSEFPQRHGWDTARTLESP